MLGLPRIVSTERQVAALLEAAESPSNGLCFCTGSFSAQPDNDLTAMVRRFAQRLPEGSFYEADHLAGSVDMPSVVRLLFDQQDRRRTEERGGGTGA